MCRGNKVWSLLGEVVVVSNKVFYNRQFKSYRVTFLKSIILYFYHGRRIEALMNLVWILVLLNWWKIEGNYRNYRYKKNQGQKKREVA